MQENQEAPIRECEKQTVVAQGDPWRKELVREGGPLQAIVAVISDNPARDFERVTRAPAGHELKHDQCGSPASVGTDYFI